MPATPSAESSRGVPRLLLAPGLRVVPAGRDHWQVGSAPAPVWLRRDASVDAVMEALRAGTTVDESTAAPLEGHDVLFDPGAIRRLPPRQSGDVAAVARLAPGDYERRWAARSRLRVQVKGTLGPAVRPLLDTAGLTCRQTEQPDLVLILHIGELDRARLVPLVRRRVPHLVCRIVDGAPVIGPFTVPGRTACLHCVDMHAEEDAFGATERVQRYAHATSIRRRDDVPEPQDTVLATLLTAWMVREVATYADGDLPGTWSRTHHLAPDLTWQCSVSWLRHPRCGCLWG